MSLFHNKPKKEEETKPADKQPEGHAPAEQPAEPMKEETPAEPQKSNKTLLVGTSGTSSETGNIDVKLIEILNKIENLDAKLAQNSEKTTSEIANLQAGLEKLSAVIKGIPVETIARIHDIKKNQLVIDGEATKVAKERIRVTEPDVIDGNILKIIRDAGKLSSLELLKKAESEHICSKNTLYSHLKRLESMALIEKKREGHQVIYVAAGTVNVEESLPVQEAQPDGAAEQPDAAVEQPAEEVQPQAEESPAPDGEKQVVAVQNSLEEEQPPEGGGDDDDDSDGDEDVPEGGEPEPDIEEPEEGQEESKKESS